MGSSAGDRDEQQTTQRTARRSDPSAPEPEVHEAAPDTPRSGVSAPDERPVHSPRTRENRRSGEDTLLSLPAPADGEDPAIYAERIAELDRRIDALDARVKVLEVGDGPLGRGSKRWLAWIAFMLTLAVAWQIVQRLR